MFGRAVVAAVALFVGGFSSAVADTYEVSLGQASMLMTLPDSWKVTHIKRGMKVTHIKRGMQAVSPDGVVYIWAEAFTPDQFDKLTEEHDHYYDERNVTLGKGAVRNSRSAA